MGRPVEGNSDPLACAGALEYFAVSPRNRLQLHTTKLDMACIGFGPEYFRPHLPAQLRSTKYDIETAIRRLCWYCMLDSVTAAGSLWACSLTCPAHLIDSMECTWHHVHRESGIEFICRDWPLTSLIYAVQSRICYRCG